MVVRRATPSTLQLAPPRTPLRFVVAAGDSIAPVVSVVAPANGAVVSATSTVTASASDNVGVTSVKWYVDNVEVAYDTLKAWSQAQVDDPLGGQRRAQDLRQGQRCRRQLGHVAAW